MADTVPEETEGVEESPRLSSKTRARLSLGLSIACAALLALAVPALWANNLISNTDAWVDAVSPLAADPAIQDAFASQASEAIKEQVDAVPLAEKALPDELQILAIPVGSMVNSFIDEAADGFVRSSQFYGLWKEMNELAHSAFTAIFIDGNEGGILSLADGELIFDLTMLVDAVAEKLEAQGLDASDLGSNLEGSGRVVLFDSQGIAAVQSFVATVSTVAVVLIVLALCALAGALFASPDRRRTGFHLGIAGFIALALAHLALTFAQNPVAASLAPAGGSMREALIAAYGIVFSSLLTALAALMAVCALAAIVTFLMGPSRPAVAVRDSAKKLYEKGRALVPVEGPQQ